MFLVLAHDRRRIVHFNVTAHPTAEWTGQQLREAFPFEEVPRYLLRDRDGIFGAGFTKEVRDLGIEEVLVLVQGPRGAGKTTLLRREFPAHTYVTLDDARDRARARLDPRAFLARLRGLAVIDDLHRAPELMAHIVGPRPLILASSRRLQLPFETFELYPPTQAEREGRPPLSLEMLGRFAPSLGQASSVPETPQASDRPWLDRDVRALIDVHDLDRFESFFCFLNRGAEQFSISRRSLMNAAFRTAP